MNVYLLGKTDGSDRVRLRFCLGVVALLPLFFIPACTFDDPNDVIEHPVTFYHPGSLARDGIEKNTLRQPIFENPRNPKEKIYAMDVSSVFCGESICKIDVVTMYWDGLGRYKDFLVHSELGLEKNLDVYFDQDDYRKLDEVLSNRQSGLKDIGSAGLIRTRGGSNSVDSLTGATISILKDDFVEGAIWTCYTLWHFANGEVVDIIRNVEGDSLQIQELSGYLLSQDDQLQLFALEQLIRRKYFDQNLWDALMARAGDVSEQQQRLIVDYLDHSPYEAYMQNLSGISAVDSQSLRLKLFQSLVKKDEPLTEEYLVFLATNLASWPSYQEVNSFFELLTRQEARSSALNQELMKQLDHQSFLVSRRVYWHLIEQPLNAEEESALQKFEIANKDRL